MVRWSCGRGCEEEEEKELAPAMCEPISPRLVPPFVRARASRLFVESVSFDSAFVTERPLQRSPDPFRELQQQQIKQKRGELY